MNRLIAVVIVALLSSAWYGSAQSQSTKNQIGKFFESEIANVMSPAQAKTFSQGSNYTLCFVPDGASCERLIVDSIRATKKSLLIQAYSFTSAPIAKAVVDAHKRGVDVRVILDKSQRTEKYSSATFLKNAGIEVVIDERPQIAHNKILCFDMQSVFTGSFNFSKSAQERNAENGIVIHGDQNIIRAYAENWSTRYKVSVPF